MVSVVTAKLYSTIMDQNISLWAQKHNKSTFYSRFVDFKEYGFYATLGVLETFCQNNELTKKMNKTKMLAVRITQPRNYPVLHVSSAKL